MYYKIWVDKENVFQHSGTCVASSCGDVVVGDDDDDDDGGDVDCACILTKQQINKKTNYQVTE